MKTKFSLLLAALGCAGLTLQAATVRIVQTNAAGDSVMLIDPGDQQGGRRDQGHRGEPRRRGGA